MDWRLPGIGLGILLAGGGIGAALSDSADEPESAPGGENVTVVADDDRSAADVQGNGRSDVRIEGGPQVIEGNGNQVTSNVSSSNGVDLKTYSATGRLRLGTIRVREESRLVWTNDEGRPFKVTGDPSAIAIDSSAGRGEIKLPPGVYEDVEVEGALWTITIRPR